LHYDLHRHRRPHRPLPVLANGQPFLRAKAASVLAETGAAGS